MTGRARVTGLAAAAALLALLAPGARAGRVIGAVEVGYDTYMERYSIAESDTLSSINEARARIRIGWATGLLGRNYTILEARQYLGESSWESTAHALVTRRVGAGAPWVLNLDAELSHRGFNAGSGYEFPNDYTRAYARAGVRGPAGKPVQVRVDDRVERLDYQYRTEFDYDYTRNIATAVLDLGRDPFKGVSLGARFTTMSIPDSSEIEYHSLGPVFEGRYFGEPHQRVYVSMNVDRRAYPGDGTRSSFWSVLASGLLEWPFSDHWGVEMASDVDGYNYDVATGAYDDYVETRNYVAVNWFNEGLKVGAGPAFGWLTSRDAPDEEYHELGARMALEQIGVSGLYLSLAYEPGLRDYPAYTSDARVTDNADAIFSDYVYHRVNLFANVRITRGWWFNALLDWQPEDHDRDGDDATATVGSASLTYQF